VRELNDRAIRWAFQKEVGDSRAKFLLCTIAAAVDGHGRCSISVEKLSRKCELTPRTTLHRLHRLEEMGLLEKRPASGELGRRGLYDFRLRGDEG
jgi:DNA-binding MarR family transcriptional regulator